MGNKADELACLNLAIEKCSKQRGVSKQIAAMLSGQDVERKDDERPDFLRYSRTNEDGRGIIIGIEHFRVDHFSEEMKNHRVSSLGVQYEKNIKALSDKWQPQISEQKSIPEGALKSMSELIAQLMSQQIQASYNAFIEAFRYSLNKHLVSVEAYHAVLDKHAGANEKKLALLIEIHSDFSRLFFHDKRGVHYGENTIPLFEDLVKILETINSRKVHYLILCFGSTVFDESTRVIAVPTHNLRKQFEKQNIPIYCYAGHDIFLSGFQTPQLDLKVTPEYKREGYDINFHMTVTSRDIKDEKKLEMVVDMYRFIKQIERRNRDYATTDLVEMFYEVFDEYFSELKEISTESIIQLIPLVATTNKEKNDLKLLEFEKKWGMGEDNDHT